LLNINIVILWLQGKNHHVFDGTEQLVHRIVSYLLPYGKCWIYSRDLCCFGILCNI